MRYTAPFLAACLTVLLVLPAPATAQDEGVRTLHGLGRQPPGEDGAAGPQVLELHLAVPPRPLEADTRRPDHREDRRRPGSPFLLNAPRLVAARPRCVL